MGTYTITKKVAKHGSQSVIVIPRILENELSPSTIVQVAIEVLKNPDGTESNKGFIVTKRIAKHGSQAIIVVPRILENELRPSTVVQLTISIIKREDELCQTKDLRM